MIPSSDESPRTTPDLIEARGSYGSNSGSNAYLPKDGMTLMSGLRPRIKPPARYTPIKDRVDVPILNEPPVRPTQKLIKIADLRRKQSNTIQEVGDDLDDKFAGVVHIDGSLLTPHPIVISKSELLTVLKRQKWLSDSIINSYLSYLSIKYPNPRIGFTNTFFFTKIRSDMSINKWEGLDLSTILSYNHFLIPVEFQAHWTLVDVMVKESIIRVLDSSFYKRGYIVSKINNFIKLLGRPRFDVIYVECPKQKNSNDCGAFILKYAKCIFLKQSISSFNQKDIFDFRKEIFKSLRCYATD